MTEKQVLAVGKAAQDFTLSDQSGQAFHLSEFRGKKVLLSFHPLAWTSICATQMQDLEKNADVFDRSGTAAVGVSIDSVPCKKAWADSLGIKKTRLLADFWPHGAVAKSLGVFRDENGFSERCNIILDEKGKVLFVKIYPIKQLPDIKEILDVIK
ncbi:MAG TPA: redoxin domain-containing protein [Syntrophales bacterium]|nr:redoxin domain-containing protein [Syntrophales bacterium]HOX93764.1 redoxin domain-containing protein [Syntrophales bacterium]HPI55905.1 redoxin domain-containing protein [Syntrophales bacterium]HPN23604.1 redoxin domain-containing protein [Syntrophales bacterium]HQM27871.1 redoxin domain-containing protein [Syntrophales bacterium]